MTYKNGMCLEHEASVVGCKECVQRGYNLGYSDGLNHGKLEGMDEATGIIIKNIKSRISDLRACTKNDNCQEFAALIESYIPEWTEESED